MITLHVVQHALSQDKATDMLCVGLIFGFGSVL